MEEAVGFFVVGNREVGTIPLEGLAGAQSDVGQQASARRAKDCSTRSSPPKAGIIR